MILDYLKGQMEKLEELLPGIEVYLCETLAAEKLSSDAEDRRQYFLERLDILKLPPSRPPRSSVSHLKHDEAEDETVKQRPTSPINLTAVSEDSDSPVTPGNQDFAARQRELSRTLLTKSGDESEDDEEAKVYDDIGDEDSEDSEQRVYEVPVTSASNDDLSPSSEIFDCHQESSEPPDSCDTTLTDAQSHPSLPIIDVVTVTTPPKVAGPPPPLPPRHHRQSSEDNSSTSNRLSLTLDEPPKLPARPHLPPRSEIYALSERSDKSVKSEKSEKSEDHTDDGSVSDTTHIKPLPNETVTSYESYEDDTGAISQDSDLMSKLNIKLPMPLNRKKKKRNAYSKSQSSSQWDLNLSFRDLDEVSICGELNIHGKLTWSRRLVAVTNRRLLCYKPEKMSKPTLVVQLLGYQATYNEREKHKGYEILLHHPLAENYVFGVELLEWAQSWCEYIQAACEGKDPPGRALRLYRHSGSYLTDLLYRTKSDPRSASSNSIASSDGSSTSRKDFRSGRMTLAQRASTFLAKKKASKKMTVIGIPAEILNEARPRPLTHPSTGSLERRYEGFPRSLSDEPPARSQTLVDTTVSQKGYVHVYSSFSRKRICKRWCVVRGNHFECYPSEKSQVCEMRFPLNICTFRQAKAETNSEKGIMIVENDAEKITVEPVEFELLDDWISVLLRETLCDKVPEGLDKYYTEKTYEVPPEDLTSPVDDPDDPYACINDLSVENAVDESEDQRMAKENEENLRIKSSENTENKENQSTSKPKNIADMYSPVLWENKRRNSSKSSIKNEKENLSQSPQTGENQSLNSLDPGNNSQSTTPDGQPLKPLYSAAVTDSGYTTASSPTSSNQQPLDEVGNTESNRTVTSPSQPASMSSLLKRWDVKTKIQNLEKGVSDHKHSRQKSPKPKTPDASVKTKVFSFEKKTSTTTPTPTPPKRKRSNSKNNALKVKNSSPKLLKPVSLDFETSSAKSEKTTKDIQPGEINTENSNNLSPKEVPEEKIDNSKAAFSEQSSAPLLPLRQDSMTSSYDTDSCVTDSSDSALRSEHETPTNSDVESWNLSKNEGPEYKNAPDESPLFSFDYFSTSGERGLPGNRGSREGTVERLSSRESSTEPTTSCSSWDSSQETNCYNFGYDSSSDANPEEPDEIFLTETQTNCEKTLSKDLNVSRSSENSVSSEVTLLSNKTLSVDSLDNGCHNQNSEDLVFLQNSTEDTTDLPCKLSTLRTELVELKKNRIQARDKKLRARGEKELTTCEEKFEALDKSCKLIAQQITELEGRIKLSGSDLTQSSEA